MNEIKTQDLIFLAKYGQGLIIFDQLYIYYIKRLQPDQRSKFFHQIISLIRKIGLDQNDIDVKIHEFTSNGNSVLTELLADVQLKKIEKVLEYQDTDLKKTSHLLLELFSVSYKRAYNNEIHNGVKFWFWDFGVANFNITEMNLQKTINIEDF